MSQPLPHPATPATSVSPDEIARFDRLAARWWEPTGPMRPLHQMNPLRIGWTATRLAALQRRRGTARLRVLDLGCGAGIATESLSTLGHEVLGIDAAADAIEAAKAHAALTGAGPTYRVCDGETLVAEARRFDAVVALEVIEHATDPAGFLRLIASLLEPDGLAVLSTLNRTWRSLALAKIGAEYIARLLPIGTHDWRRFVTPAELASHARVSGFRITDIAGMVPSPIRGAGTWAESRDLSVNYIAALTLG